MRRTEIFDAGQAKAVAKLEHPNILDIHDFGTEDGVTYSVTELLEGETLREWLEMGALGWRKAADTGAAIAEGLAAAHGKGVVHRDIKPSNTFLCSDGREKILDFGLAATHEAVDSEAETGSIEAPLTREGSVDGDGGLHGARTGAGRARRSAERHLFAGVRALRDGDRSTRTLRTGRRSMPSAAWRDLTSIR